MSPLQLLFYLLLATSTLVNSVTAQLPNVTLPWGTWQATSYEWTSNSFVFNNIRFGQSPTGKLRFQKPLRPAPIANNQTRMDNLYGPSCYQVQVANSCNAPQPEGQQSEDCLFLDVYVPRSVWDSAQKGVANTPVVVWIYGGAYEFGAKSAYAPNIPFYNGTGVQSAALLQSDQFIFVAGNYRLGAFGWLAGNTMEARGSPNAGLYDQRLLLEWVRDYIHLFGGNKNNVSAWGESAGAGSIMHHLMRQNGTVDPLFQRVLVQSPAFQWNWDRTKGGTLDQVFLNFTRFANCSGSFDCLLTKSGSSLALANQLLYNYSQQYGLFPVGPSVDGQWIQTLPDVAYSQGKIWKGIKSMAISHVEEEAYNFVPPDVTWDKGFDSLIKRMFPEPALGTLRTQIENQYPWYGHVNERYRAMAVIGDAIFYCNTRTMFNAYTNISKVYMMNYQFFGDLDAAVHASDLLPTFNTSKFDVVSFLQKYECSWKVTAEEFVSQLKVMSPVYQSYLADLAISGDPNTHKKNVSWPLAKTSSSGNSVENVLNVNTYDFTTGSDDQNSMDTCGFWYNAQAEIMGNFSSWAGEQARDYVGQPQAPLRDL